MTRWSNREKCVCEYRSVCVRAVGCERSIKSEHDAERRIYALRRNVVGHHWWHGAPRAGERASAEKRRFLPMRERERDDAVYLLRK